MRLLSILPLLLLYTLSGTHAGGFSLEGINCNGALPCLFDKFKLPRGVKNLAEYFLRAVDYHIAPTDIYHAGDHIFCVKAIIGGICLYTQGTVPPKGVTGARIQEALGHLVRHGCTECGSVPLSGNNDPLEMGILTINYVALGVCRGVCPKLHNSRGNSFRGNSSRGNSSRGNSSRGSIGVGN